MITLILMAYNIRSCSSKKAVFIICYDVLHRGCYTGEGTFFFYTQQSKAIYNRVHRVAQLFKRPQQQQVKEIYLFTYIRVMYNVCCGVGFGATGVPMLGFSHVWVRGVLWMRSQFVNKSNGKGVA